MATLISPTDTHAINEERTGWYKPLTAGVLATLIIGLLLDLLGIGIGFSLFSPSKGVLYSLSIGAIVWLFVVSITSMYSGGWIASYFTRDVLVKTGVFNGIMVSSISIIILLVLTMSALGSLVSGTLTGLQYTISSLHSTVEKGASTVNKISKGLAKVSPELSDKVKKAVLDLKPIIEEINQKAAELLSSQTNEPDEQRDDTNKSSAKTKTQIEKFIANYLNSLDQPGNDAARQNLINSLSKATGKSETEINQKIDEWQKVYLEAKEKTRQATKEISKDIAKKLSQLSLLNFFLLASGIISAILGGMQGIKKEKKEVL